MSSGPIAGPLLGPLLDLGPGRIAAMDAAGIDVQVLSVSAPGVQHLRPEVATPLARLANDRVHELLSAHPTRFAGMATLPMQSPADAAAEVMRAVDELGLSGVLVNSHTEGRYLDDPRFEPVLEAIVNADVPLYLHPREPSETLAGAGIPGFTVGWAYAVEVGTHVLRMISAGVFDRFPDLRIILGHLGESLPLLLDRIDDRYRFELTAVGGAPLERTPSSYFREHVWVTTSGMNFAAPVRAVVDILGPERVLFAADHPMEDQAAAAAAFRALDLNPHERTLISHENAERVFGLAPAGAAPGHERND
ncbi:amidohydrolase family protein [Microbacterium oryzae]|uniref:amidohydrolase family protein n=1 Tax=Microbacterium oryzae TaxID=743009 RepID=UPI0025B1AC57|nr:amidohydrolase family protein [Microbacterium oryzae]MDN3310211.1 amidohydrolase family protein [Microbacterium oryzae]